MIALKEVKKIYGVRQDLQVPINVSFRLALTVDASTRLFCWIFKPMIMGLLTTTF